MKKIWALLISVVIIFSVASTVLAGEVVMMEENIDGGSETVADYIASYDIPSIIREWVEVVKELEESGADSKIIDETNRTYKNLLTVCHNHIYDYLEEYNTEHIALIDASMETYYDTMIEATDIVARYWTMIKEELADKELSSSDEYDINHVFSSLETTISNAVYNYMHSDK